MKKLIVLLLTLSVVSAFAAEDQSETIDSSADKLLKIRKVALSQKTFDPSNGDVITLMFEITKDAAVVVNLYDILENNIRSFDLGKCAAGKCSVQWDGQTNKDKQATGPVFLYVITAVTENHEQAVYNPAQRTGGLSANPQEYTYDHEKDNIEYVLPKACMVRIRAGLKEGMLVETLMDWVPHTAGRHQMTWDGKDGSGLFNIGRHPQLELNLTCYTLPNNAIIRTGDTVDYPDTPELPEYRQQFETGMWARANKNLHYQHWPLTCHEPQFTITFPESKKHKDSDIPVVSGRVPVRITFDSKDAVYIINKRFEVMVYIDGIFLFEVEEGSSPFTFHWDTEGLSKGEHIMTINVMTYDDHIGTLSRNVIVGD